MTSVNLSYPIGEYKPRESISKEQKDKWIQVLEEVPAKLKQAVEGMTDSQLDTPYRDGGWTGVIKSALKLLIRQGAEQSRPSSVKLLQKRE